ncbi:hypothetical protein NMY22_g19678 [Coprinellus aureogranulatus]|nr:hypothetical protein NMY22_g19678 [Coprinellus aureogranulatus]
MTTRTRSKSATGSAAPSGAKAGAKGAPTKAAAKKAPVKASASTASSSGSGGAGASKKHRKGQEAEMPAGFTPEAVAAFQAWQVSQQATSEAARLKAAKVAKDKNIQDLNAQLLAAEDAAQDVEEDASDGENPHPKKKGKLQTVLEDNEQAAADDLSGGPPDKEEEDRRQQDDTKNSTSQKASAEPQEIEENDEDGNKEEDEFDFNGLEFVKSGLKPSSFSRSVSRAPSPAPSCRGSNKVTCGNFDTDELKALADAAKGMVRMNILFGKWGASHGGKVGSQQWAADILNSVVKERPPLRNALKAAFRDEATKEDLLTYILYGKGVLLNTLIRKARLIVASNYGLTGTKSVVSARVAWLLKKNQFKYGGIDIEAQTFEKTKIWGNPMIKELLQLILFSQGARADARSVQEIRKNQEIPISAIILCITAIEHSIGKYRDGSNRQYPFKEQTVRARYTYHEHNWTTLRKLSEKWATFYVQGVF